MHLFIFIGLLHLFCIARADLTDLRGNTPCDAYKQLSANCANPLPHSAPLNSTHEFSCFSMPKGGCEKLHHDLQVSLNRNSWWHCKGSIQDCALKFNTDLQINLLDQDCWTAPCGNYTVPDHLVNLKDLSETITDHVGSGDDNKCQFNSKMELIANLIVQKSRYCRFDLDNYYAFVSMLYEKRDCFNLGNSGQNNKTPLGNYSSNYNHVSNITLVKPIAEVK